MAYSVDPSLKLIGADGIEKKFLRDTVSESCPIPRDLLYRTKAMQCEGVGLEWVGMLQVGMLQELS